MLRWWSEDELFVPIFEMRKAMRRHTQLTHSSSCRTSSRSVLFDENTNVDHCDQTLKEEHELVASEEGWHTRTNGGLISNRRALPDNNGGDNSSSERVPRAIGLRNRISKTRKRLIGKYRLSEGSDPTTAGARSPARVQPKVLLIRLLALCFCARVHLGIFR